jgi:hypothetical protein
LRVVDEVPQAVSVALLKTLCSTRRFQWAWFPPSVI